MTEVFAIIELPDCPRCAPALGNLSGAELMLLAVLHQIHRSGERIMGALEDLQAAVGNLTIQDASLVQSVTDLATEQAIFLRDVADALANAGTDPTALNQITATLNNKADDLAAQAAQVQQLMSDQVNADPANQQPTPPTQPAPDQPPTPTPTTDTPPDTTTPDTPPTTDTPDQPSADVTNAVTNTTANPGQ